MQVTADTATGTTVQFVTQPHGMTLHTGTIVEHEGNGWARVAVTSSHKLGQAEPRSFSIARMHIVPLTELHTTEA